MFKSLHTCYFLSACLAVDLVDLAALVALVAIDFPPDLRASLEGGVCRGASATGRFAFVFAFLELVAALTTGNLVHGLKLVGAFTII